MNMKQPSLKKKLCFVAMMTVRLSYLASLQHSFMPDLCSHLKLFIHPLHSRPNFTEHFLSILPFCRKREELKALNSLLIVRGLLRHQPLLKQFVSQCCHLGFPGLALPAFKVMEKPGLYLQNLILTSLCNDGLFEDAIFIYKECHNSGFFSNNYTYPFVIKACAALCDVGFGEIVHCLVLRSGFGRIMVVQTGLVDFYSKIGEMRNACKLVDEMSEPDVVAWNAMISGYSVNGLDYEVLQVLQRMRGVGVNPNASTLASVLPVCSRFGVEQLGYSLHGLSYKLGYHEFESLVPAFISMYANRGDLSAASSIFETSTKTSIAVWNAIISAYTRNSKTKNAVQVFKTMLLEDMKANMVTFVSLLPSLQDLGSSYVAAVHGHVVKFGFEEELSVVAALLSVYAKLGNVVSAEFLFRNVSSRNLLLWNSMISAYAGNGLPEESIESFSLMQVGGLIPDSISILSLLSSCSELKASLLGKSAHAFTIRRKIDLNLNASNALLDFYCSLGELAYSFRIFDRMVPKNVVSWNTMISGCVDNGESESAILLFHQMRQGGVNFDLVTLISILPSCHGCQNLDLGLVIHGYATRAALTADISLTNALICMYSNFGELHSARSLFDNIPDKNVVSWNAVLTGYRYSNLLKETIELFNQMIQGNQRPNYVTLLIMLPVCHTLLHGKSHHSYIIRRRISLETPLLTSLIIMYAKFGNLSSSMMLFHIGDRTSISLWNAVTSAHLLSGNGMMVFPFFRQMLQNKLKPDCVTALNLISACAQLKNLHVSNSVLAYLLKEGLKNSVATGNALIDLYAKCGSISSARVLFNELLQRDTISWSTMINAYGLQGDAPAALTLYSEMRLLGIKPDKVTYLSILSACSHAGFVEQGKMVFDSMIRDGILPGEGHYACIVDLLSRRGYINEAYEIVKSLPDRPSLNLLESLLGACLCQGYSSIGEEIGRWLLDMDLKDSRSYVILHNIYAAAGKWIDAKDVRQMMEQKHFSKDPGISFVDGDASG